jgi:hypothetical protein
MTSTEIATIQPGGTPLAQPPASTQLDVTKSSGGALRLVEWAQEAQAANHLAKALVRTPFAGAWRNDEDGATAAILKGAEVGLTPVTALGAFDNIQGTPAPKAMTLRALVQSAGHDLEITESTEDRAVARYRRHGRGDWLTCEFTLDDARRMGLLGKDNWRKQPRTMLEARVTSKGARLVGSDVILGIGYSAEELWDQDYASKPISHLHAEQEGPPPTASARVAAALRGPQPEPTVEPVPEQAPAEGVVPESPALDMNSPLAKRMFAVMNEAGFPDEGQRDFIAKVLDRPITSRKDLTEADARVIIGATEAVLADPVGNQP